MSTKVQTTVIGSYPVSIDTQQMMHAYFNQQEIDWTEYILAAVQDLVESGINIISDGQTRDPFLHIFLRGLHGCRIRQRAEITDQIRFEEPITLPDILMIKQHIPPSLHQVGLLAGPYTLSQSTIDLFYDDEKELAFDFAEALNQEARAVQNHVSLLSIDEPFFSQQVPDYAASLIKTVLKNIKIPVRLHVCGNVSDTFEQIMELPVDILSHEFKATPQLFDVLREYSFPQSLCLGAVRSDHNRIESVDEIRNHLIKGRELFGEKIVQIAPDCGQRFLSRDDAFQKLKNLVHAAEDVYG